MKSILLYDLYDNFPTIDTYESPILSFRRQWNENLVNKSIHLFSNSSSRVLKLLNYLPFPISIAIQSKLICATHLACFNRKLELKVRVILKLKENGLGKFS